MVRLAPARQYVEQRMIALAEIELAQHAAERWVQQQRHVGRLDEHLGVPVEIEVVLRDRDAGDARRSIDEPFRRDEITIGRRADVAQIQAPEHAVPVRTVALAAPQRFPRRWVIDARKLRIDTQPALVHAVRLGVLREKVAPEAAAHVAQHVRAPVGIDLLGEAMVLGGGIGGQRPLHHLGVRRRGQVGEAARLESRSVRARRDQFEPVAFGF